MNRVIGCAFLLFSLFCQSVFAIERISVSQNGQIENGNSDRATISGNGRFVVFQSKADNLVEGDTNNAQDVFVWDKNNNELERVSVSSSGEQADLQSSRYDSPKISFNGRFVAFSSDATNLVENDTNNSTDVFVHDRVTKITKRISVSASGEQANNRSYLRAISGNGNITVFTTRSTNLVNHKRDDGYSEGIFFHKLDAGITKRIILEKKHYLFEDINIVGVSTNYTGSKIVFSLVQYLYYGSLLSYDRFSNQTELLERDTNLLYSFSLSADGRYMAYIDEEFGCLDTDCAHDYDTPPPDQYFNDLVLYDSETNTKQILKFNVGRTEIFNAQISGNGEYILFSSSNSDLIYGDTNGVDDLFVYNRNTQSLNRVNVSDAGIEANLDSRYPSISHTGEFIAFTSKADNLTHDDVNDVIDVFNTENPLFNEINLVGVPNVDPVTESGVYIWKNNHGRTFVKVVAGDQNGDIKNFTGSILAEDLISSLTPNSIEFSTADELTQVNSSRVDFDLFVKSPLKDDFSFISDSTKALCLLLTKSTGELFLGPDKVEVISPYDINTQAVCDARTVPLLGAPVIDKTLDSGIFIWKTAGNRYKSTVVSVDGLSLVEINVDSEQPLSDYVPIGLEASDLVEFSPDFINLNLRVAAGAKDGFKFKALSDSNSCFKSTNVLPIYVGPLRAKLGSSVNLDTLKPCN